MLPQIWDFNGHCHHVLVAGDGNPCDITEVLPLKRIILVVGWDREGGEGVRGERGNGEEASLLTIYKSSI